MNAELQIAPIAKPSSRDLQCKIVRQTTNEEGLFNAEGIKFLKAASELYQEEVERVRLVLNHFVEVPFERLEK